MYLLPTDGHKSFYGKAIVFYLNGRECLRSYNTIVASRTYDGEIHRHWSGWSATTGRHIRAFCGLNKKEFDKLPTEDLNW